MMTGLQSELRDRILGSTAHAFVFKTTGIHGLSRRDRRRCARFRTLSARRRRLSGARMASSPGADAFISFKGIDPELEATVTKSRSRWSRGSWTDLKPRNEDDYDGIVLGQDLAKQLGVNVGDRITLLTPTAR